MAAKSKCLTRDKAGIQEFIDGFDLPTEELFYSFEKMANILYKLHFDDQAPYDTQYETDPILSRCSFSTVMVCPIHPCLLEPNSKTEDDLLWRRLGSSSNAEYTRRIGVLWSGDHLFDGTVETLEMLRSKGKQTVFVTNNSTKSRADYKKKLESMGIPASVDEIFPSSYSAAIYISRILHLPPSQNTVFVLGESGIETELDSESISHIGGTDPAYGRPITPEDYSSIASGSALDPSVGIVLVGLDHHINYLKLSHALAYLKRGAVFLATNLDVTLPSAGSLFPGAGSISAPLIAMMGGEKPTSCGKPSQSMMDAIEGKFRFERKKACMVGDRLDTDIKFGIEGGLGGTLCVLSGVTRSESEWEGKEVVPTAWVRELGDLRG
ncbi:MAG: hypothetical protein Q9225_001131 [Loekoesia sp. 1 TL-2023]